MTLEDAQALIATLRETIRRQEALIHQQQAMITRERLKDRDAVGLPVGAAHHPTHQALSIPANYHPPKHVDARHARIAIPHLDACAKFARYVGSVRGHVDAGVALARQSGSKAELWRYLKLVVRELQEKLVVRELQEKLVVRELQEKCTR